MHNQLLPTDSARRFAGAGRVNGLGQACAYSGGAATTKTNNNNTEELALPAEAGGVVGACAAWSTGHWSDEPMPRADHKAKRHGRPVSRKYKRPEKKKRAIWDDAI